MALIWGSTTSQILLNETPGRPIKHARGLRQGDPLSPMLFILVIDPLQRMLDMATQQGLLSSTGVSNALSSSGRVYMPMMQCSFFVQ
jgi:hypothetical protein